MSRSKANLLMALTAMCLGGIIPETSDVPAKPERREPRRDPPPLPPTGKSNIDDAIAVIEAGNASTEAAALRAANYNGNVEIVSVRHTDADTRPRRLLTPESEYERNAAAIREETQRRRAINFRKRLPKGHPDRIES
jgi:hypothetical protein